MRTWRKFVVERIECWKNSIEAIISIYNRNFNFKTLLKSHVLQGKTMIEGISSESVFQKRFDGMIAQKSKHPELLLSTEFLKI